MKVIKIILIILVIVLAGFFIYTKWPQNFSNSLNTAVPLPGTKLPVDKFIDIKIGDKIIKTEVRDTDAGRTLGLSGHAPLAEGEGMLFIFDESLEYTFWMKDMLFPIDIIWIDANKKVIEVSENASPESYTNTFSPVSPAMYVLEVPAGTYSKNNIHQGDRVDF